MYEGITLFKFKNYNKSIYYTPPSIKQNLHYPILPYPTILCVLPKNATYPKNLSLWSDCVTPARGIPMINSLLAPNAIDVAKRA